MVNSSHAETLISASTVVRDVVVSGFVLTFLLNLLLKGVMSQLWNIFNTLQIILALPMMNVVMPVNVLLCKNVVD